MKSIYKAIQELEKQATQRKREAEKAGEDTAYEEGYLEALIDIEVWIDVNKREIETPTGYVFDVVNAEDEDL